MWVLLSNANVHDTKARKVGAVLCCAVLTGLAVLCSLLCFPPLWLALHLSRQQAVALRL